MRAPGGAPPYPYAVKGGEDGPLVLDFSRTLAHIIEDALAGRPPETVAASFHETVIAGVAEVALGVAERRGLGQAALSGGAFQNARLLEGLTERLRSGGLHVATNAMVPLNDGGISLGQALVLRETLARKGMAGLAL
jgi:hydrogenase maturation protein HypF